MKSLFEEFGKVVKEAKATLDDQSSIIKTKFAEAQEVSNAIVFSISTFKESISKSVALTAPQAEPIAPFDMEKEEQGKIEHAIEKLSGHDKVGTSAEVLTVVGGSAVGAAAAGTVAGAAGATTLFGSTGLASVFGGVFVTTTPVGWVIGSAIVAGAAGYGLVKMIRSGAQQDIARKEVMERLTQRLSTLQAQREAPAPIDELKQLVALTLASDLISESQGRRLIDSVENKTMNPAIAIHRLKKVALEAGIIEECSRFN
jgi:hypothetical protein